jgi:hypothetical protein
MYSSLTWLVEGTRSMLIEKHKFVFPCCIGLCTSSTVSHCKLQIYCVKKNHNIKMQECYYNNPLCFDMISRGSHLYPQSLHKILFIETLGYLHMCSRYFGCYTLQYLSESQWCNTKILITFCFLLMVCSVGWPWTVLHQLALVCWVYTFFCTVSSSHWNCVCSLLIISTIVVQTSVGGRLRLIWSLSCPWSHYTPICRLL